MAKKPLLDAGVLTVEQMGQVGFGMLFTYAIGKTLNGFIADWVHLARFMATGLLLSAGANVLFGLSGSFLAFLVLWSFNGWFQSVGATTSGVTLASWFDPRELGTRYGVWSIAHSLGEGATFVGTAVLVHRAGWRWGFIGPGLVCLAVALVLYRTLADRPVALGLPPVQDPAAARAHEGASIGELQLEALRNPMVWILGLASASMYVARYALNNWGVLYLQVDKGYSLVDAAFVVSLFPIVGIFGSALSGIISDRLFQARRGPVTTIYGVMLVVALAVLFFSPPGSPWLVKGAMAVAGFATGGQLVFLGGLAAMDISSKRAAGAALGIVGGLSYAGAAAQDWISGAMIESTRHVVDGKTVYDFGHVRWVWVGAAVVSLALAMTLGASERRRASARARATPADAPRAGA
ncbi:MAG: MFS transporter [Deltaproteobacteria bacterium]|nr:MFS transporter [Deltaproteobacteria bacterium]